MRPRLRLIVARARNGVIGRDGALPWRLPEDLARFRQLTMGHSIVMGRKTWDSIGRPLPGRRSIVVTRDSTWQAPGAIAAPSLERALEQCADIAPDGSVRSGDAAPEAFIIGGAQIYAQALALPVETVYLTEIDADIEGDARFPPLEASRWRQSARETFPAQAGRPFSFSFIRYESL